jgi:hypothetical protein
MTSVSCFTNEFLILREPSCEFICSGIFGPVMELVGACAVGGLVLSKSRRVEAKVAEIAGMMLLQDALVVGFRVS